MITIDEIKKRSEYNVQGDELRLVIRALELACSCFITKGYEYSPYLSPDDFLQQAQAELKQLLMK